MTTQVLRIDSSLFGENGVSSQLNNILVEQLRDNLGEIEVVHRDLAAEPVPHFSAETIAAVMANESERTPAQKQALAYADGLIDELIKADIVIIAAPMYNFGVPSALKAWIDHLARAGTTFKYTENGPVGLIADKPVYVVTTRGGIHKGQASDTLEPYLNTYLNFLGLKDIRFVFAEALNMGKREESMSAAEEYIKSLVSPNVLKARSFASAGASL